MKRHIGKIFILAIAVIMLCSTLCSCGLLTAAVVAGALSEGEETTEKVANNEVALTPTKATPTKTVPKTVFNVGETYSMTKRGTLTFDSCEEYISTNRYSQPKENYKYIVLTFTAKNTVTTEEYFYWDFECYADDTKCEQQFFNVSDSLYIGDNIGAGRKLSGKIFFEVPVNAEHIEIEYKPEFFEEVLIKFIVK